MGSRVKCECCAPASVSYPGPAHMSDRVTFSKSANVLQYAADELRTACSKLSWLPECKHGSDGSDGFALGSKGRNHPWRDASDNLSDARIAEQGSWLAWTGFRCGRQPSNLLILDHPDAPPAATAPMQGGAAAMAQAPQAPGEFARLHPACHGVDRRARALCDGRMGRMRDPTCLVHQVRADRCPRRRTVSPLLRSQRPIPCPIHMHLVHACRGGKERRRQLSLCRG